MTTKTHLDEIDYSDQVQRERVQVSEGMSAWQRRAQFLDQQGFAGDIDVTLIGLEEMEDELTMAQAERAHADGRYAVAQLPGMERRKATASPAALAPAEDTRAIRGADIDDMTSKEWDSDGE